MTEPHPLVLLVEDEAPMRKFICASLENHGYRLVEAEKGRAALDLATSHNPDLILLDLGLPDMDGIQVTEALRTWTAVPILVISARGQEADKIRALDAGADDYITKPFGTGELLARIRVGLRHLARAAQDATVTVITIGELQVDLVARLVHVGEREVHLTPLEYKLLSYMAKNAGKVLSHRQLLKEVWGPNHITETPYLRVFMGQLRHKLESVPAKPRWLATEPGVGYRLRTE